MKKFQAILLTLVAFILISAKGGCNENQEDQQLLIGEWKWVKSFCCGRTSTWIDLSTCNCNQKLIVAKDGTYQWFKNDTLTFSGKYEIRKGINDSQYAMGDSALVLNLEHSYPAYVEFIGDTLLLSMGYMDYSNDYFVPMKK